MGEAIGAKTLHTPALVIDTNQGIGAHVFDVLAQGRELFAVDPIARKQNQPTRQRVADTTNCVCRGDVWISSCGIIQQEHEGVRGS